MSWNKPGLGGPDPLKNKQYSSPPDLDKLIAQFFRKLFGTKGPSPQGGQPSFRRQREVIFLLLGGLFLLWALSGFYIVNPAEQAVVLRFGKYVETVPSGLHWVPKFIESRRTVDIQKIYSFPLHGNFLTKSSPLNEATTSCIPSATPQGDTCADQSKNLVDIELTVMYRISDPRQYLFGVVSPDDTIHQLAASALSEVAGGMQLDEVLTTGREMLASEVLARLKASLQASPAGLDVVAVTLRKVQAPEEVREAFNDVNRAVQDRKTAINQAEAYASRVIPLAKGTAARTLADAKAIQQRLVLKAEGDVARYQALLRVYLIAPEVTRTRLYFDTLQDVYSSNPKVLLDLNRQSGSNPLVYVPLDRLMGEAGSVNNKMRKQPEGHA